MEGTAKTILSNVGQLVGEEFQQLRAVGGEVAELRDELATMNAVLRMQTESEDGSVDHFIREWMKQVRELAYDAEDCVDLYIFRIRCRSGDRFLVWTRRLLATLFHRHRLAGSIKDLRARAVSISERHARYGVNRDALRKSPSAQAMATASSAQALYPANGDVLDQFVGIQDQADTLSGRVKAMSGQESEKKLKVFSIVGFGGLGKTTLAVQVCRQLEGVFDRQALVSVSQAFDGGKDLKGLLKRVLQQVVKAKSQNEKGIDEEEEDHVANIDGMDVENLAITLEDILKGKRYLIVVDDVWTIEAWDVIRSKLPDSECGSRIIVTTRIENVAKECSDASVSGHYVYQIKELTPEYSKKLFISRAFGSMKDPFPEGLEDTMKSILKKCAGLPLAIVSIASLLRSYKYPERKDMWDTICSSIGSQMESNPSLEGMSKILTLSYNHLPYHLKGCMMYLAIFPEDYEINKNRLLYRWIAERLVEEKRGLTALEVAESYFDELISRSMISTVFYVGFHGNKIEACRVHDMMLEVLVSKSLEANFVSLIGGQFEGISYDRVRRLSIQVVEQEAKEYGPSKRRAAVGRGKMNSAEMMDLQHVRSLTMFDFQGQELFDRLGEFTLLRVLDLEDCKGLANKHVKDICQMYLLKFLSLKGTDITKVPKEVGELEHLQVFDVRDTGLGELPETVTKLEKVERMDLCREDSWDVMWTLPKGLSRMKALREVERAKVDNVKVATEIGELGQLRRIFLFYETQENLEVARALAHSLSKLCSLRSLSIGRWGWGENDGSMDVVLNLKSPPRLLRYLYIDGQVTKLPDWLSSLSNLAVFGGIWLRLRGDQLFGALCELPNLQTIKLWKDCYVDQELVARTAHHFPILKALSVCSTDCIYPQVIRFEEGSMVNLEELTVVFSQDNRRTIVGIQYLTNLKEVQLRGKRSNYSLNLALEELKAESDRRPRANQFMLRVTYD